MVQLGILKKGVKPMKNLLDKIFSPVVGPIVSAILAGIAGTLSIIGMVLVIVTVL